ncbi:MAG: hypothetical protein ACFFAY_06025 [Promethearchaeota archaeon]
MLYSYQRKPAALLALLLLSGVLLIAFHETLVYEYEVTEYYGEMIDYPYWNELGVYNFEYVVDSVFQNQSRDFEIGHLIAIPHFNITPGPVSILVYNASEVVLNLSMVSGDLVAGIPYPAGDPGLLESPPEFSILISFEGTNSTVAFSVTLFAINHAIIIVEHSRTLTKSLKWTGYVGCIMIMSSLILYRFLVKRTEIQVIPD